ncbi:hypothetical protein AAVH_07879 [Aphelenchoides avenae]|nr:hypothetical protein AAVH_07879 [Aphelenchus avenae]
MEEKPVARSVPRAKKRLGLRIKTMFGSLRYYAKKPFRGVIPSLFSAGAIWTVCYWAGMRYFLPDHPLNNYE